MIIRVFIAGFASFVAGLSYLTGLGRLMTALIIGFSAFSSFFLGVLFMLPVNEDRLWFPISAEAPAWPFFILAIVLLAMVLSLFLVKSQKGASEHVSNSHFKYLLGGIGGILTSLFLSSIYWFPSDAKRLAVDESSLATQVLLGTGMFFIGISVSCFLFYKASKGTSERHPDLMRRFVLGLFTFCQFDKMPLLVAYLLINSSDTKIIFPGVAVFALSASLPVAFFLVKTTLESREM
jgi:hypothetical protein